jgi:FtsP/CotA-like multicopper oxidase with cupredoxin domain
MHEREMKMSYRNHDNGAARSFALRRAGWLGWIGGGALGCLITLVGLSAPSIEGRTSVPTAAPIATPGGTALPMNHTMGSEAGAAGAPTATPLSLSMADLMAAPVDYKKLGFDPDKIVSSFDYGTVTRLADGHSLRRYTIVARDKRLELAPGVFYDAWTFNDQIPGPTLRATEGDTVQVVFINAGSMPHSMHFHGIHPADQDGLEAVEPGGQRIYTFPAGPAGLHLYHCHVEPLAEHIGRGLYGAFIVDPRTPRAPAHELVMVLNAFDFDGDGENDIYAANSVPFAYYHHPIALTTGELVRIYLVNMTETDPINSFHLHANLFWLFRTGTRAVSDEYTDTVMMSEGERHVLEFTYNSPGEYMFHAHQAELSDLGWMGCFAVHDPGTAIPTSACSAGMTGHAGTH